MKYVVVRNSCIGFMLACSVQAAWTADDVTEPGTETDWTVSSKVLACTPKHLTKGDTLSLQLGNDHGLELAIHRVSDNAWFFLVAKLPFGDMHPLMSAIKFGAAVEVDIKMDQRGYERPENPDGLIFTTSGEYDVYTSNALESEEGGFKCVVTYEDKKK